MYQFSTTNVINSAKVLDQNGTILVDGNGIDIAKYSGSATGLDVKKVGFFKKANIVSIYKRPYTAGVLEVAGLTVSGVTTGDVLRLTVDIKLSQSTQSEYTNYSLDFKKPIVVEVISVGNATTDATALKTQLNALKNRFGHSYFTTASSGAALTFTAKEFSQRFNSIVLSKATANTNSIVQYDQTTLATGTVSTAGKLGFGDDAWMIRSIMLPTAENVRYFGISKEERPVLGGNYTEYVLRYSVTKDGTDGIVSGGTSVTTHVFYVKSDLVSGFETEITNVGLAVPATLQASYTVSGGVLSTGGDETDQITVTGAVGAVTYATTDSTKIAVGATTGLVTTAGKTATGAAVVTVTDGVGATDTVTYDIQA